MSRRQPAGVSPWGQSPGGHPRLTAAGSRERPAGGFELYAWLFMRLSGIALLLLALGHLFIMHVFNSVHTVDYQFVAGRYARWFWRAYDLAMLWLAMLHGVNGLRILLDDYLRPPWRGWAVRGLALLGFLFLGLGTWVILFFNPASAPGRVF